MGHESIEAFLTRHGLPDTARQELGQILAGTQHGSTEGGAAPETMSYVVDSAALTDVVTSVTQRGGDGAAAPLELAPADTRYAIQASVGRGGLR